MTILFRCPSAPRVLVANPYAGEPGEPDEIETSSLPEVEMTNANAAAMLDLLRLPSASYGDIDVQALPAAIAILEQQLAVAQAGRRSLLESPDKEFDGTIAGALGLGPGKEGHVMLASAPARIHSRGRSRDYVERRLGDMVALLRAALDKGIPVSWD